MSQAVRCGVFVEVRSTDRVRYTGRRTCKRPLYSRRISRRDFLAGEKKTPINPPVASLLGPVDMAKKPEMSNSRPRKQRWASFGEVIGSSTLIAAVPVGLVRPVVSHEHRVPDVFSSHDPSMQAVK